MSDNRKILAELESLDASHLYDLKMDWKQPFSVPNNYFLDLKQNLKNTAKQSSIEQPFSVPDNYFDELKSNLKRIPYNLETEELPDKISLTKHQSKRKFSTIKYLRSFSAVAASLFVIVLGWKMITNNPTSLSPEEQLAQIINESFTESERLAYIEYNYLDTYESEITTVLNSAKLDQIEENIFDVSEAYIDENFNINDIENYFDFI